MVFYRVNHDVQICESLGDAAADGGCVFPDATAKNQRVDPPEDRRQRPDLTTGPKDVVVDCFLRLRILRGQQRAHVTGKTRQPQKPASGMEHIHHVLWRHAVLGDQMQDHTGVNLATAGAHGQAIQRRKPHRGTDTLALGNRAHRRPVAQMRHHQTPFVQIRVAGFDKAGDVIVAEAMKPIPPDALVVKRARQGKGVIDPWMAAMKRGVKTADLNRARKGHARSLDPGEVMGLVQRGQRVVPGERLNHITGQMHRRGERCTAVDDPVPDPFDWQVRHMRRECFDDMIKCGGGGRGQHLVSGLLRICAQDQLRVVANFIDLPMQQHLRLGSASVKAEFQR